MSHFQGDSGQATDHASRPRLADPLRRLWRALRLAAAAREDLLGSLPSGALAPEEEEIVKAKPKGIKYRNLFARGGSIVYERIVGEGEQRKRIKRSLRVTDWSEAAATRDALERQLGIGGPVLRIEVPTFAEAAASRLQSLRSEEHTSELQSLRH